jgi:branched-chain amino acid transport system ATP-binding protein
MLTVENLSVYYGGIHALQNVSFHVEEGEIVTLLGANGAGKSTTLRALSGLVPVAEGTITFRGQDLTRHPPHEIVARGLSQVPEGRRIFAHLSVEENLLLGGYARRDPAGLRADLEHVYATFPRLAERRKQSGGTLSGGEQQMLAIGRALMARPALLLLDEPSLGLAPFLVREIFGIIQRLNGEGRTILLVEQNAQQALKIAHRGYVLETGRIVKSDTAAHLLEDEDVRRAYLGE